MEHVTYIVSAVVLIAAVLATGWWRLALAGLRIRSGRMTVDRLGLAVPA